MIQSLQGVSSLFRPEDEDFSPKMKSDIQFHRLLCLLGAVLVLLLGSLYAAYNPTAYNSLWARLGIAGLFAGLFAASYRVESLRRNYVGWMRGLLYVLMGWFTIVAALTGFAGDYDMGVLLLYAILPGVVGVGTRSRGPVLRFLGVGFLLGTLGAVIGPASLAQTLVLSGSLATVALVEGIALQAWLSTRLALEEREAQLRSINENISDGIYRSTPEEGLVYANQAFAEMFGYQKAEELYEADPRQMYACPETRDRLREQARNEGGFGPTEVELERKDGTRFTALLSATVLRDEEGAVKCYDGAITDITERKRAEEQLRERETRLRGLANSIPGVVYQFYARPDGTYGHHFVSEHAEEVLGISADPEGFQERVIERVPDSHREELMQSIERAAEEKTPWQFEAPFVKPSGEQIWLLGTSTPDAREEELVYNGVILDVTERKEAEQALRKERNRLETLFQNLPSPVVHGRPDENGRLRVQAVNEAFEETFGGEQSEIQGEDVQDLIVPPGEQESADSIRRRLLAGRPVDREVQRKAADGLRDFRVQVALRQGETGPVEGYAIYTDITEQKEIRRKLRESEQRYRTLTEHFPNGAVGVYDHDLRYTLAAGAAFDETLPPSDHLEGTRMPKVFPEETVADIEPLFRAAIEDGTTDSVETTFNGRNWKVWATPLHDAEGEIFAGLSFAQDVTEQKEREKHPRRTTARLETLFEGSPDMITVHDIEGNLVDPNPRVMEKTGYDEKELLDMKVWDLDQAAEPEKARALWEGMEAGDRRRVEGRYRRKDGATFPVEVHIQRLDLDGEVRFMAISRDISELKHREQVLRNRQDKVEALYAATDRLLRAEGEDEVGTAILELIRETLGYPGVSVRFARDGWLVPTHVTPEAEEFMPERPPIEIEGESTVAELYREQRTLAVEDAQFQDDPIDFGETRAAAAVPMGRHGLIGLTDREPGPIDSFDLRLIEILGAHATVVLDRIERKQRLRRERDLLDRIFETSPAAIAQLDADGKIVRASERIEDVLGLDREEVRDHAFNDPAWGITAPDGSPISEENLPFARVMSTEEPVYDVEHAIEWPDGTRRLLSVSGAPLLAPEDGLEGAVFHVEDVTERRAAERALRRSEQRFRGVFENAAIGIAILDGDGQLLDVNPALGKMTGHDPEELQGHHFAEVTYPDDLEADRQRYEELMAGKRDRYQMEKRFVRKGGEVFWGRLTVSRHEGSEDGQVVGMVEDIDDQKRYERDLRAAKEEAERMNRMKSAFLANMSHEIRTPLTSIIGFAEAIGEEVSGTDEGVVPRFARLIAKSGRRLLETLDGVLNLSKLEAGELEVAAEPTDLATEVEEATELFEPQAEEAGLELHAETGGGAAWAQADERGLRMVLQNLISNALKYTDEGGQVRVRAREEETAAVLEVEDTGIGMAQETVPELFEPFRQESEGLGREYEGSGIGLAVTKRAVDEMEGSIDVETEKGEGTCFTIRLPRATEAEPKER